MLHTDLFFCPNLLVLRKLTVHGFQDPQQNMEVMVSCELFQSVCFRTSHFSEAYTFCKCSELKIAPIKLCKIWMGYN